MPGTQVISAYEAEQYVLALVPIPIDHVGNVKWLRQHEYIEKLNMQAHQNAVSKHDEFIVDSFLSSDKIIVLIHELLVIEAWKEKVLPLLIDKIDENSSIKAYMMLFHETSIASLLQTLLYHESAVRQCSSCIIEIADYCHRKLTALLAGKNDDYSCRETTSIDETVAQTLERQFNTIEFSLASIALSTLRFLTDHLEAIPLAVVSRMLNTHDIAVCLITLLDAAPWTRRDREGVKKFSEQKWRIVAPGETLWLTKLEAQTWIALYNLMMRSECRNKYRIDAYRKTQILRLKKYFNEVLIDQLPMLEELWRSVEQLALMDTTADIARSSDSLLIEQVPEMREALMSRGKWEELAQTHLDQIFADDLQSRQKQAQRFAEMYNFDMIESTLDDPKCSACGKLAEKRCSQCKTEWYCSRQCQLDAWSGHKQVCELISHSTMISNVEKKF